MEPRGLVVKSCSWCGRDIVVRFDLWGLCKDCGGSDPVVPLVTEKCKCKKDTVRK
jgi:hypothetical protein